LRIQGIEAICWLFYKLLITNDIRARVEPRGFFEEVYQQKMIPNALSQEWINANSGLVEDEEFRFV
jgi:hypothetical protein